MDTIDKIRARVAELNRGRDTAHILDLLDTLEAEHQLVVDAAFAAERVLVERYLVACGDSLPRHSLGSYHEGWQDACYRLSEEIRDLKHHR